MQKKKSLLGIVFYALLFIVIVPLVLWFWAKFTEDLIYYPAIDSDLAGWIFVITGGALLFWGMVAIWRFGEGLPMNYSPPTKFVTWGPFRLVRHPIYWGFGILMIGVFILARSASGLWLVAPINILAMLALVLGYEKIELNRRFPEQKLKSFFDIPENNKLAPSVIKQISVSIRIFGAILLANFLAIYLCGNNAPLVSVKINFPVFIENQFLLLIGVIFILVFPFLLKENRLLREWNTMGIISIAMGLFMALLYPRISAQNLSLEDVSAVQKWNEVLPVLTVPAYLILISISSLWRQSKKLFFVLGVIVLIPLIVQLATSQSPLISFFNSIFIFSIAFNHNKIWIHLRNLSEKIANSWHEWVIGKVRIINHGFYVGLGSFAGILVAGILVGKEYAWALLVFVVLVLIVAALWAQIIEGSEKLKRPFGYYGGLAGMIFSSLVVWLMGFDVWVIVGVCTIILPWGQAIGRLRCLVNGCCHGSLVDSNKIGIRYYHHRSRVCGISNLKGEYLHPTQLYSILWLFVIGFIFFGLWRNQSPPSFILGLYLILSGIGRFVEEAFRGEVQTPIVKGLRLYQWTAIITVVIGIGFTVVPSESILVSGGFSWELIGPALIGGLCTFFAMGVDFPNSNARFSRLV